MIGQLKGVIASVEEDHVLIDVGGVGYDVAMHPRSLGARTVGEQITLVIETLVAETYIRLVGFENAAERRAFRLLQTVQGVGAKAALSILHVLPPAELLDAIAVADKTAVARAQGVGPKLAQRIVTELANRTGGVLGTADVMGPGRTQAANGTAPEAAGSGPRREAILALQSLGYDEPAAIRAVRAVPESDADTTERVITSALKALAP